MKKEDFKNPEFWVSFMLALVGVLVLLAYTWLFYLIFES